MLRYCFHYLTKNVCRSLPNKSYTIISQFSFGLSISKLALTLQSELFQPLWTGFHFHHSAQRTNDERCTLLWVRLMCSSFKCLSCQSHFIVLLYTGIRPRTDILVMLSPGHGTGLGCVSWGCISGRWTTSSCRRRVLLYHDITKCKSTIRDPWRYSHECAQKMR